MSPSGRHPAAAALLLLVLAAACASPGSRDGAAAGERPLSERVAGCWSLEIVASEVSMDSVRSWLPRGEWPSGIELDTLRYDGAAAGDSAFAARSLYDSRREPSPFSAWSPISGDSIRVQRPGAMAGTMLRLGPADGGLRGTVVGFTDVRGMGPDAGPGRRSAPVRARSMPCP